MLPFVVCHLCGKTATCSNPDKFCNNMIKCEKYIRKDTTVIAEKHEQDLSEESVELMILNIKTILEGR